MTMSELFLAQLALYMMPPRRIFEALAASTWEIRLNGDSANVPQLPSNLDFLRAMQKGDLVGGYPECLELTHEIVEAYPRHRVARLRPKFEEAVIEFSRMATLFDRSGRSDESVLISTDPDWDPLSFVIANGLGLFHAGWEETVQYDPKLKHPMAPLIAEWFTSPKRIDLSDKRAGIVPSQLKGNRALGYLAGLPPAEPPMGAQEHQLAMLPAIAQPRDSVIPTVVFYTWASAGGPMTTRGHGAPLSMRIFFEAITEMPRDARKRGGRWRLEMTLRDLRDRLYPRANGQRHDFRPTRDIANIHAALFEVDQMRVPVRYGQHNELADWRPVSVTLMPQPDLNSSIVLDIEVPPGNGGGAMIDRLPMRYYGLKSGPKYAASIGLAYYWDKYGTHSRGTRPIQATRPRVWRNENDHALGADGAVLLNNRHQPIRTYNDDRLIFLDEAGRAVQGATLEDRRAAAARERNISADLYPPLVSADLLELFYPKDGAESNANTRRSQLKRAKAALDAMAADGYCIIEETVGTLGDPAYRILPTEWDNFSAS